MTLVQVDPTTFVRVLPRPEHAQRDDSVLSPEERARCAAMPPHRRQEFTHGRTLLRHLVAELTGADPRRVSLRLDARGAPHIPGSGPGVSISHSSRHTAVAVRLAGPVGVDVQDPPPVLSERMVRRCCGARADELLALDRAEAGAAFARVWAVQEAVVKARRLGLAGAPWRVPVALNEPRGLWRGVSWRSLPQVEPVALAVATGPADPV
ncbi:4'-phosphopantetheinyl transferase superfamily protein [Streptomyces sp. NPDC031705]|uniref:4'-phosphopantetheinyl transferase family protein n=1 Tax=Streptomyces sp. NPDC031705 TaxID=3155729 RepID=UPI0033D7D5DB